MTGQGKDSDAMSTLGAVVGFDVAESGVAAIAADVPGAPRSVEREAAVDSTAISEESADDEIGVVVSCARTVLRVNG